MGGLPKFLLPISESHRCLLDYHVSLLAPTVDRIIIPTRREWLDLLRSFEFGPLVDIVEVETATMAETVTKALADVDFDTCVLGLPDTYFVGGNPYETLSLAARADLSVAAFVTRPEQAGRVGSVAVDKGGRVVDHADKQPEKNFGTHWGVFQFSSRLAEHLDAKAETAGHLISEALGRGFDARGFVADYPYFDCGTFSEYQKCLVFTSPTKPSP